MTDSYLPAPAYPGDPGDPALTPALPSPYDPFNHQIAADQAAQPYMQAYGQASSTLKDLLTAAGMLPVSSDMDAAQGYQFTTPVDYGSPSHAAAIGTQPPLLGDPRVQGDERVYMGHDESLSVNDPQHIGLPGATDAELAGKPAAAEKHKTTTVAHAVNLPFLWYDQPDKLAKLQKDLRLAGFSIGASGDALGDTVRAWSTLVQQAAAVYDQSSGQTLVTPWDLLERQKKYQEDHGNVDSHGNVVSTSRSTSTNELTEGQAWSTLRSTLQQMLGRDPSDQEVRDFLSQANAEASRDPSVSVTTTKTNSETGQSHSNTTSHGGYSEADAARAAYGEYHDTAEYAKVQSGTTYFNAMLAALGETAGSM